MEIEILGTPIAGEDTREDEWVSRIESACSVESIALHFQVEPGRKVDLDNLVRPAMRGLKKGGFYSDGFRGLHKLNATKVFSETPGLVVETGSLPTPSPSLFNASSDCVPPSDDTAQWKQDWTSTVADAYHGSEVEEPSWGRLTFALCVRL